MANKYEMKIAALISKAESTTPEEAAALMQRAEEMMVKYGIEQAIIDERRRLGGVTEDIVKEHLDFTGTYAHSYVMMGHYSIIALGTVKTMLAKVTVIKDGQYKKGERLYIVGYESDVRQAKLLVASIQLQCASAMSLWWDYMPSYEKEWIKGSMRTNEKKGFIEAFGIGVYHRMKAARDRQLRVTGNGAELVMAGREKRVQDFVDKQTTRRTEPKKPKGFGLGRIAGNEAGGKANTGEVELSEANYEGIGA